MRRGFRLRCDRGSEAAGLGIPLTTLDEYQQIDVTLDGADEVDDESCGFDKGRRRRWLLREKRCGLGDEAAKVIVADASKRVPVLGTFPLPVEVIKFAQALVQKRIEALGAKVSLRQDADGKPYLTDENNLPFWIAGLEKFETQTDSRAS